LRLPVSAQPEGALRAHDIEWTEAAGFPYAGTFHGPAEVDVSTLKKGTIVRFGQYVDSRKVLMRCR
jgi:hypothetical protein